MATKSKKKADAKTAKENEVTVQEPNLVNAPVEGTKASAPSDENKGEVNPIDDPASPHYIRPPRKDASGTELHNIAASRGEEVGFHQIPQGGIFNNTNLKA